MPGMQTDINGVVVMALRPSQRVQNLTIGASSVSSTTFLARQGSIGASAGEQDAGLGAPSIVPGPVGTSHVRLVATVDCWISIGSAPFTVTATNSTFLPASSVEYFPVTANDVVSVLQSTAGGTLNITEC